MPRPRLTCPCWRFPPGAVPDDGWRFPHWRTDDAPAPPAHGDGWTRDTGLPYALNVGASAGGRRPSLDPNSPPTLPAFPSWRGRTAQDGPHRSPRRLKLSGSHCLPTPRAAAPPTKTVWFLHRAGARACGITAFALGHYLYRWTFTVRAACGGGVVFVCSARCRLSLFWFFSR